MKRSFLEELGLEKEVIDKVIAENGSDIENAKSAAAKKFDTEREALNTQISELQAQVTQRDADLSDIQSKLEAAQDNADKLTEAQDALAGLQSKYDSERQEWEAKAAQQAYEFAVREKAGALNFSSTAAKREFIRDAIKKEFKMENDMLLGFDDYVKVYKDNDPGAFAAEEPATPPVDPKQPEITLPGNPGTPGKVQSLSDLMKAKNENPDLVVSFDK